MNLKEFIERVNKKHSEVSYDFSKSEFKSLNKDITYICPIHGEVTQAAKKVLTRTGCPQCDKEAAKKKRRSGSYARRKGNAYELKIIKELNDLNLGYECVSSRVESKRKDDGKVDIVDINGKLPINIQCKKTKPTPNYFKIAKDCPFKDKPFVVFWDKQSLTDDSLNMKSSGEVVLIPKEFFYELLKSYDANSLQ